QEPRRRHDPQRRLITRESGRWGPYRQASHPPARHRPAPGLRAARAAVNLPQATPAKEATMSFRSLLTSLKFRSPAAPVRQSPHRPPAPRLRVEALEDRSLPSGTVALVPGEPAPQLVGEAITWTATASGVGANPVYQFRVAPHGGTFQVV